MLVVDSVTLEGTSSLQGRTYPQWMVALIVNVLLFTYGLHTGWVSPMTKVLQSENSPTSSPLSDEELSWIASTFCFSAMLAAPFYSYVADKYGRKIAMAAVSFFQLMSWVATLLATNGTHLIIARAICGIASGGCFNIVPMYTKEISQDNIRGILGSLPMLLQNFGILFMYAIGSYLDYYTVLWIVMPIPLLVMFYMFKAPESPSFLVKVDKIEEATSQIAFLRGLPIDNKQVQFEIDSLKNEDAYFKSLPTITFLSILKDRSYRKICLLCITIFTVTAFNGSFAVIMYAASILRSSGVTFSPELQTLIFPIIMIVGSLASMSCVEKYGRKPLYIIMLIIAALSFIILGSTILIQNQGGTAPGWLSVLAIVSSLFSYACGVAPIPYVVMTEILNFQIRSRVMGLIVMYAWFISFVQLAVFAPFSKYVGMHTTFFCFAGVNALGAVVSLVFMPETKGKSTEELENEYRKK